MQMPEEQLTQIESQSTPAEGVDFGPRNLSPDDRDELDVAIPPHTRESLPVVGLGGSAGAIPALRDFFSLMPPDSGMVFVVVIHLMPGHESTLPQLLQQSTAMRVIQVTQAVHIERNCVYVIPPDAHLSMSENRIHLLPVDQPRGKRVAVDLFFCALADTHGTSAIGVILSGADGDGAIGLKRIKERGGLTIAQEPSQAEHDSMPRSAITTGMVDWILPVEEMPAKLLSHLKNEKRLRLPPEALAGEAAQSQSEQQNAEQIAISDEAALREVLTLLRSRVGHDFTHYKRATVLRRIGRWLQVNGLADIPTYLDFLRTNPGEAAALLNDLLISVTNFFRDPDSFTALQEILPRLFEGKKSGDQIRVWVAGCATGEEAYSLGMLLAEYSARLESPPSSLIFATDLSEAAIQAAREGAYSETIVAEVSPERLRRFFTLESGRYRVKKELRESVLFAVHNLLEDSPFSRIDLITCRNLLIYLNREAQQRVFETFHFALRPEGVLFLGTSESADDLHNLFAPHDKKHRLYSRRVTAHRVVPPLPLPSPPALPASTAMQPGNQAAFANSPPEGAPPFPAPRGVLPARRRGGDLGGLHLKLLERFAPPSVMVNEEYEILHLSESAGRFLQHAGGEISSNLLKLVHPSLRLELNTALFGATQGKEDVRVSGVPMEGDSQSGTKYVDIQVRPVFDSEQTGSGLILVFFEEAQHAPSTLEVAPKSEPIARKLHEEILHLKASLRSTVEQYEESVEELKASNEELQSVNEELITVNQELKSKIEGLGRSNSDLQNLMTSTDIGTIFLDRQLRIKRYTPRASQIFHIIPSDIDRPLSHLTHTLEYSGLAQDGERVLAEQKTVEREVRTCDQRWFLARLLPYHTLNDHIDGVVLTLIDITERKKEDEKQRWLASFVESSNDAIVGFSTDRKIVSWNRGAEQIFGYSVGEAIGQPMSILSAPEEEAQQAQMFDRVLRGGSLYQVELIRRRKNGALFPAALTSAAIKSESGQVLGVTSVIQEITERKKVENELRESEERFRLLVEGTTDYAMFLMDTERRIIYWNSGAERIFGFTRAEVLGQSGDIIFTPEDRAAGAPEEEAQTAVEEGRAADIRWHLRKDGSRFWTDGVMSSLRGEDGNLRGFAKIARDASKEREAEDELRRVHEGLERRVAARTRKLVALNEELRSESTQRLELERARQQLLERVVSTQEEERRRISRELHDQMGQQLTALLLGLKSLPSVLDETTAAVLSPRLQSLQKLTDELMGQVHHLAWELRPPVLDNLGLKAAVKQYAQEWSQGSGVAVDCVSRGFAREKRLPPLIETTLYRVVQESLTNVQRHANARRVSILLERIDGEVVAVVEDDGQGFSVRKARGGDESKGRRNLSGAAGERLGLLGMRERVELVGGVLTIESKIGEGTSVYARIPINQEQTKDEPEKTNF